MKILVLFLVLFYFNVVNAQTNCTVYKDKPHQIACQFYWKAIDFGQGSKLSQELFINSLTACPAFGPSLHEMSVPYLKRGDFYTWKLLMDQAVKADPNGYLGDRGWCLFKFLRDYKKAFNDLETLYHLTSGQPGYSGDGDYDLRIIMALCQREIGNKVLAMHYFNECITDHESKHLIGLFDYLFRGVTLLKMKRYEAALANFNLEIKKYAKLADTYYYMGLCNSALHRDIDAQDCFIRAKELYLKTGYHRFDPYCEEPDQVYLSDILKRITN